MEAQLDDLLKDPLITSAARLWARVKERHLPIRKKDVNQYWKSRANVEVLRGRPVSTEQIKIHAFTNHIGCIQIDLMDVGRYSGHNGGTKFLLNCIDIYSRYAWSFPVPNKKPATMVPHLRKVIADVKKECKRCLITIFSDDGSEFKGVVNALLASKDIAIIRTTKKQNQAIVERFNQRIWGILNFSYFSKNQFRFVDKLPMIIRNYNDTRHQTTAQKPDSVFKDDQIPENLKWIDVTGSVEPDPIKPGDQVRVAIHRKQFEKASTALRFSQAVYTVVGKEHNRFILQDSAGKEVHEGYLLRELMLARAIEAPPIDPAPRKQLNSQVRQRRLQRQEPAFADREHTVDDSGRVSIKPRLAPANIERVRKAPVRYQSSVVPVKVAKQPVSKVAKEPLEQPAAAPTSGRTRTVPLRYRS